jgi:hypothetical protein
MKILIMKHHQLNGQIGTDPNTDYINIQHNVNQPTRGAAYSVVF